MTAAIKYQNLYNITKFCHLKSSTLLDINTKITTINVSESWTAIFNHGRRNRKLDSASASAGYYENSGYSLRYIIVCHRHISKRVSERSPIGLPLHVFKGAFFSRSEIRAGPVVCDLNRPLPPSSFSCIRQLVFYLSGFRLHLLV